MVNISVKSAQKIQNGHEITNARTDVQLDDQGHNIIRSFGRIKSTQAIIFTYIQLYEKQAPLVLMIHLKKKQFTVRLNIIFLRSYNFCYVS